MLNEQLKQVAVRLQEVQVLRNAQVAQGRRAYRLGIELRDNPRNLPTDRKLWEEGWTKEARDFAAFVQRTK